MALPNPYDAVFYVSFGGPEGMDDVMPYLDNVLRGKRVPHERKLEVAHHYELFGGVSPINEQNRAVIKALETELKTHGSDLPVYFGNRNWHPLIPDALQQMKQDGVKNALVFISSAFSCYSGCRQYRENLCDAMETMGEPGLAIDKIRVFYNHPGFIEANADHLRQSFQQIPEMRRDAAVLLFTAHSIPMSMATGSRYEEQLLESCRLVAEAVGRSDWRMVFQSRSGPPHQPWLEPDVCDVLPELQAAGVQDVVVAPVGFVSDHLEVLFDLDTEAKEAAEELGLNLIRTQTVGIHPAYISMIRELIEERMSESPERRAIGRFGPSHDVCPTDCCWVTTNERPVSPPTSS